MENLSNLINQLQVTMSSNYENLLVKRIIDMAEKIQFGNENNLWTKTKFAILIEYIYKCEKRLKIQFELIKIRKKIWNNHFGVPTINFFKSFDHLFILNFEDFCKNFNNLYFNGDYQVDTHNAVLMGSQLTQINMPEAESNGLFIKTLNMQGYMTTQLDDFSKKFIQLCNERKQERLKVLEIGAAYGVVSLAAIQTGAYVFANDLSPEHLQIIHSQAENLANKNQADKLITLPGRFPEELEFEDNFFDAVLICRVLHFFTGEQIKLALGAIKKWLKPGGKIFIVVETPFLSNWKTFTPVFLERKTNGAEFPGELYNPKDFEKNRSNAIPNFIHFMDDDVLKKLLSSVGFEVADVAFINRAGQFPEDIILDGRESVGAIGIKGG
jgi:SAM-dependent methyltransferase